MLRFRPQANAGAAELIDAWEKVKNYDHESTTSRQGSIKDEEQQSAHAQHFAFGSLGSDFVALGAPSILALCVLPALWTLREEDWPLWAHILIGFTFESAHIWATAFRTYLDAREFQRRKVLYLIAPFVTFALMLSLHVNSPSWFWTFLAYCSIAHIIEQDCRLIRLYAGRDQVHPTLGQFGIDFDSHVDTMAVVFGALLPLLTWHANDRRKFAWFNAGEQFLFSLDASFRPILLCWWVLLGITYFTRQVYRIMVLGHMNVGRLMIVIVAWVRWAAVMSVDNRVVSASFVNFTHAIPSLVMVYFACKRLRTQRTASGIVDSASAAVTRRWWLFMPALFLLALPEEVLWDALVMQDFSPRFCDRLLHEQYCQKWPRLGERATSFVSAALVTPQVLHMFLDCRIWRMDVSNPGLSEAFFPQARLSSH